MRARNHLRIGLTLLFGMASSLTEPQVGQLRAEDAKAGDGTDDRAAEQQGAKPAVDAFGDPLPAAARLRLGTVRFRPPHGGTALALSPEEKQRRRDEINADPKVEAVAGVRRGIALLAQIGTPAALQLLEDLANGNPTEYVASLASRALNRARVSSP